MTMVRHGAATVVRMAVVVALVALTGCTAGTDRSARDGTAGATRGPFAACPQPTGPAQAGTQQVPDVALPCFTGTDTVSLARAFGKPTIVNFWASWCAPCREELPAFQRYADQVARDTPGEVLVVGVVTGDRREAAASLATDLNLSFPALYDADRTLTRQLGRSALPLTLFFDAQGRLVHLYQAAPLTDRTLRQLVATHLKVDGPRQEGVA